MTKEIAEKLAMVLYRTVIDGVPDHHPETLDHRLKMAAARANAVFQSPARGEADGGYMLGVDSNKIRHQLDKCPLVVVDPKGFSEL